MTTLGYTRFVNRLLQHPLKRCCLVQFILVCMCSFVLLYQRVLKKSVDETCIPKAKCCHCSVQYIIQGNVGEWLLDYDQNCHMKINDICFFRKWNLKGIISFFSKMLELFGGRFRWRWLTATTKGLFSQNCLTCKCQPFIVDPAASRYFCEQLASTLSDIPISPLT